MRPCASPKASVSQEGPTLYLATPGSAPFTGDLRRRDGSPGCRFGLPAAHLAGAAVESIALQEADVLDAFEKNSGRAISELRVDAGPRAII